ncbi:MAG: DASH complex subunit ask1 [Tremellales sp. Tagirdzhanova-0007]|nr:MAG: DASH complex subunit ask1 [Tremellales sp. Tagirdzhanova-0007]
MSHSTTPNPLLQPPFFLIPGINASSPISAQTEQIDQLNTLLLQEIDANFARFHQIVTTRILPEIKRFAIAGEPTREAATFWKSFFEAAAAIRVPVAGDHSNIQTSPSQLETTTYDDHTLTLQADDSYLSPGHEDGAFMFQTGPTSSTPRAGGGGIGATGAGDESWEDSMESPFDRVERRLREELRIGETDGYASSDAPTPSLPSGYDLPGLDGNGNSTYGDVSTGTVEPVDISRPLVAAPRGRVAPVSSQSFLEQTDTPKAAKQRNPSNHATMPNSNSNSWNGITDLRSTPLNARFTKPMIKADSKAGPSTSGIPHPKPSFDDSDDDVRLNMSPPVTMTFNLPPRAQAVFNIARTPAKSVGPARPLEKEGEARMILDDLMEEMERGYEPSPRMATPEGLGRYSIVPAELGLPQGRTLFDTSGDGDGNDPHPYQSPLPRKSMANTSFGSDGILDQTQAQDLQPIYNDDEDSFDVDDSFDSPVPTGPTGYTSTQADDSDLSMSPNTSEAGIIFGGPAQKPGLGRAGFSLMKPDEMMTYHGGRLEDAAGRELMDSPTHALRGTQR